MKFPVSFSIFILILAACSKDPETLVRTGYDEAQMEAAIARARREVEEFVKVLAATNADSFSVKAPIKDENGTEHFWITDVRYEKGEFVGMIGNDPGIVENVKIGQVWRIKKEEISDWMYVRGERIHGGYTIDVLLPTMDEAEANSLRRKLVR
jgi:uncharacterized protein YegJ (DUF2314 family)